MTTGVEINSYMDYMKVVDLLRTYDIRCHYGIGHTEKFRLMPKPFYVWFRDNHYIHPQKTGKPGGNMWYQTFDTSKTSTPGFGDNDPLEIVDINQVELKLILISIHQTLSE